MHGDGASGNTPASSGTDTTSVDRKHEPALKQAFLSKRVFVRVLSILFVIGITATIFVYRDQIGRFDEYGYLGAFLIALITSATIILPMPGIVLIAALSTAPQYNPLMIGLAAGAGSALGEITGYMAGYSGQLVFESSGTYRQLETWMKRRGAIVIFILSFVPNPLFDLAGGSAGVLRYPLWRFLTACFLGKTLRYILVACFGWFVAVTWF